jgi:hypothetical protein
MALSAATRAMPTPRRPREYTLTQEDAARLRPAGWRRWIATIGTSRDAFSRPFAVGLTTLGLAGLLVATVPSVLPQGSATSGSPAAIPVDAARDSSARPNETAANPEFDGESAVPDVAGAMSSPAPAPASSDRLVLVPGSSGWYIADQASPAPVLGVANGSSKGSGAGSGQTNDVTPSTVDRLSGEVATGVSPMIVLSGGLLIVGLGLFLIRWAARRFGD